MGVETEMKMPQYGAADGQPSAPPPSYTAAGGAYPAAPPPPYSAQGGGYGATAQQQQLPPPPPPQPMMMGYPGQQGAAPGNAAAAIVYHQQDYTLKVMEVERSIRLGFLRKVYSLLSLCIALTVGIACMLMFAPGSALWLSQHTWIIYIALILTIILLFVLMKYQNSHPINLLLLFAFALVESFMIGVICAAYYEAGAGKAVAIAFAVTMGVFFALTAFTLQSRVDWSFLGAGLYACVWVLLIWGIMMAVVGFHTTFLYSLFGAIIFCGFIVYNTNNIVKKFTPDQYIVGAISLYIDTVNLFMFILAMTGRRR